MNLRVRYKLIIVLFGAAVCLGFCLFQPSNQFADNPKVDANKYLKIYEFFQGAGVWENVRFGIHNRLAIPFLLRNFHGKTHSSILLYLKNYLNRRTQP